MHVHEMYMYVYIRIYVYIYIFMHMYMHRCKHMQRAYTRENHNSCNCRCKFRNIPMCKYRTRYGHTCKYECKQACKGIDVDMDIGRYVKQENRCTHEYKLVCVHMNTRAIKYVNKRYR